VRAISTYLLRDPAATRRPRPRSTEHVGGTDHELFAPGLGLIVYETGKAAAPNAGGSVTTSTWTMALRNRYPDGLSSRHAQGGPALRVI
jgi:hypothetical protein